MQPQPRSRSPEAGNAVVAEDATWPALLTLDRVYLSRYTCCACRAQLATCNMQLASSHARRATSSSHHATNNVRHATTRHYYSMPQPAGCECQAAALWAAPPSRSGPRRWRSSSRSCAAGGTRTRRCNEGGGGDCCEMVWHGQRRHLRPSGVSAKPAADGTRFRVRGRRRGIRGGTRGVLEGVQGVLEGYSRGY